MMEEHVRGEVIVPDRYRFFRSTYEDGGFL